MVKEAKGPIYRATAAEKDQHAMQPKDGSSSERGHFRNVSPRHLCLFVQTNLQLIESWELQEIPR